jgi:hypothetical protein
MQAGALRSLVTEFIQSSTDLILTETHLTDFGDNQTLVEHVDSISLSDFGKLPDDVSC